MSIGANIAGIITLAVLSAFFLAARFAAKRTKSLPWSLDDTLLVLALVRLQRYCIRVVLTYKIDLPICCRSSIRRLQVTQRLAKKEVC